LYIVYFRQQKKKAQPWREKSAAAPIIMQNMTSKVEFGWSLEYT
jgi:hypothetical protein